MTAQPSRKAILVVGAVLAVGAMISGLFAPDPPTVGEVARATLGAPEQEPPEDAEALPGFEVVGARSDEVDGRDARTVVQRRGASEVRDTVLEGRPLDLPDSGLLEARELEVAQSTAGDISIVYWHAAGETRLLASQDLDADALVALLRRG